MTELPRGMWHDLGNGVKIFVPGETADDIRARLREEEERRLARMAEMSKENRLSFAPVAEEEEDGSDGVPGRVEKYRWESLRK
jgi:hypothetical protein